MSMKSDLKVIKKYVENFKFNIADQIECKTMFNDLIDTLCKDGEISEKTYSNAYLTFIKNKMYIVCGSYKELLRPVVLVTYDNYKELNKYLKCNHLEMNEEGYLSIVNNRTNMAFSIVPFEDYYSLADMDLQ